MFHTSASRTSCLSIAGAAGGGLRLHASRARRSLVDASKVLVAKSSFGDGAFATCDIQQGELVEHGLARRIPVDGHRFDMCFTWSEDRTVWATCSGPSMFYNTSNKPNTEVARFFDEDRFEIRALRDIRAGEALTHRYKSLSWRKCFSSLHQAEEESDSLRPRAEAPWPGVLELSKRPRPGVEANDDFYRLIPPSKVDFNKVLVLVDTYGGHGCFAACPLRKGEVVERGIVRIAPLDGNYCPHAFLWGDNWALGSGASMFYNHSANPNTESVRDLDTLSFQIRALRNIKEGEELTHRYHSIAWRLCFSHLRASSDGKANSRLR